ncbi:CdaR family transcriptional regulator [Nocardia sp. XZ_19_231]|uniref:PucR family transcriptional regulator n=1 Tax=Nocardia sp. XZ_19_231 TaxID=2769252 RepID=UPI0018907017|nr:helix-turn-helix domain-containing protein [Nocardia sp. XZ_19_231]
MTTDYSPRIDSVRPRAATAESSIRVRVLADELVARMLASVATRRGGVSDGALATVDVLPPGSTLAAVPVRGRGDAVRHRIAAPPPARTEVPSEVIDHAIDQGFETSLELIASSLVGTDEQKLTVVRQLATEMLDSVTAAISLAYADHVEAEVVEDQRTRNALAVALLGGQDTSAITRCSGFEIAESYSVLAVHFPSRSDGRSDNFVSQMDVRRMIRNIRAALDSHWSVRSLSRLDVRGGVVLIPSAEAKNLDTLLADLSAVAGVEMTATCAEASPTEIPATVDQLYELLDLTQRMQRPPGLFRFADLAVEYQLTRPSPVRRHLDAILNPLDDHPILMETLCTHLDNNLNRRRTARQLSVHMNTIDYRLKGICKLTGFDPSSADGLWYLQSALVVRKANYQENDIDRGVIV